MIMIDTHFPHKLPVRLFSILAEGGTAIDSYFCGDKQWYILVVAVVHLHEVYLGVKPSPLV